MLRLHLGFMLDEERTILFIDRISRHIIQTAYPRRFQSARIIQIAIQTLRYILCHYGISCAII